MGFPDQVDMDEEFAIKWNGVWHLLKRHPEHPQLLETGRWEGSGKPRRLHEDRTFETRKKAIEYLDQTNTRKEMT